MWKMRPHDPRKALREASLLPLLHVAEPSLHADPLLLRGSGCSVPGTENWCRGGVFAQNPEPSPTHFMASREASQVGIADLHGACFPTFSPGKCSQMSGISPFPAFLGDWPLGLSMWAFLRCFFQILKDKGTPFDLFLVT